MVAHPLRGMRRGGANRIDSATSAETLSGRFPPLLFERLRLPLPVDFDVLQFFPRIFGIPDIDHFVAVDLVLSLHLFAHIVPQELLYALERGAVSSGEILCRFQGLLLQAFRGYNHVHKSQRFAFLRAEHRTVYATISAFLRPAQYASISALPGRAMSRNFISFRLIFPFPEAMIR